MDRQRFDEYMDALSGPEDQIQDVDTDAFHFDFDDRNDGANQAGDKNHSDWCHLDWLGVVANPAVETERGKISVLADVAESTLETSNDDLRPSEPGQQAWDESITLNFIEI
ncbi:hypothetical protein [Roseibium sp. MMSF_3544]|uniref:hypothetical protein n=1 Tax=unclassified Roseibium TaxID=2629323 RepID=UPI00273F081E|nr:hypothetical protein [Roseibium sp. MMSF_3544]